MSDGLPDPVPVVTATLRSGASSVQTESRASWVLEDLIVEVMTNAEALRTDSGGAIEVTGQFAGAAPTLTMDAALVSRLAATRTSLSVRLEPIELARAIQAARARRQRGTRSEVSAYFLLRGDFDPNVVTVRVGLSPTSTVRKSTPRRARARVDTWKFQVGPVESRVFPDWLTERLLAELLPRAAVIAAVQHEFRLQSSLVYIADCEDLAPEFFLTADQFEKISELGTTLKVAYMVVRENDTYIEF